MIEKLPHWLKVAYLIAIIYLFLFSINLLGQAFRLLGSAFAEKILVATSNPFLGLFLGLASTSIIQTSAMTVATVVSLVSAGALTISSAILSDMPDAGWNSSEPFPPR
jgi:sodium-dependent phosphate cotransporter